MRNGDKGVLPRHLAAHMGTHGPLKYTVEAHWEQLWACFGRAVSTTSASVLAAANPLGAQVSASFVCR
jgi:hypothetical protein